MRKFVVLLALIMVLSMVFAPSASAAVINDPNIKRGTPVIDGTLDDIYRGSTSYTMEQKEFGKIYNTWGTDWDIAADVYFLWDDDALYLFFDITDGDVITMGERYVTTEENPWENDAVESWFVVNNEVCKIHNDAYGYIMLQTAQTFDIYQAGEPFLMDVSSFKAVLTDKGYAIEVALVPKVAFSVGDSFGYSLQLNDIQTDETFDTIYCSGSQHPSDYILTLSDAVAVAPVVDDNDDEGSGDAGNVDAGGNTEAGDNTENNTPAEGGENNAPTTQTPTQPTTPPATSDGGIIVSAIVMAAAAAVVLKKKH